MIKLFSRLYHHPFIRFGFIGGLGFFVNEAALLFAHYVLHSGPRLSWLIAFFPAVTFTWWGNRTVTFTDRASHGAAAMVMEWIRFILANSIGAAANYLTYELLIDFAPTPFSQPWLALIAGVLVGMLFNFTLSAKLVFRVCQPKAN